MTADNNIIDHTSSAQLDTKEKKLEIKHGGQLTVTNDPQAEVPTYFLGHLKAYMKAYPRGLKVKEQQQGEVKTE